MVTDLPGYLRGREPGEVPRVLTALLGERGVPAERCHTLSDPAAGARWVLDHTEAGDLALLLTLTQRDEVLAMVEAAANEA